MLALTGHFHAHITFETDKEFEIPSGWKQTIIILNRDNRFQKDVMITRHFMVGGNKHPTQKSVLDHLNDTEASLIDAGLKVTRVKLEHEDLPTINPSPFNYREAHVKIRTPIIGYVLNSVAGYVQSRNPMVVEEPTEIVFLNARYYKGTVEMVDAAIDAQVELIKKLNPSCQVLEVKKETTVHDTNLKLDKWWA